MRIAAVTVAIFFANGMHEIGFADDRRVEIEVLTSANAPLEAAHEWLQVLKQLKIDQVRMRSKRAGDVAPSIQGNSPDSRTVRVTALLTSDNRLSVPKASFRRRNLAELKTWVLNLRSPQDTAHEKPIASPAELLRLRKKLAKRVSGATEGVSIVEFLATTRDWGVPFRLTARFDFNETMTSAPN